LVAELSVQVRYYAGARAAAGVAQESCTAATIGELVRVLSGRHPGKLAQVLVASSLLRDGQVLTASAGLNDGDLVEVLPPFAGG
jgi:molybdopterin synthase sulfur carrier subunit